MTENTILWLMGAQATFLMALIGWLAIHERRCADKWSRHMQEYGAVKAIQESVVKRLDHLEDTRRRR